MKKIFTILSLTVAMFSAQAQKTEKGGTQGTDLSIGAEVGLPIGDLKDAGAKTGFGGSAKVGFNVINNGYITVSAGFLSFGGEEILGVKPKYNVIPLKAGFRYNLGTSGFYVEPQLGVTIASVKVGSGDSESEAGFTWAPNVGFMINRMFDISARYESASIDNSNWNHIGFRLAYNFNLGGR